MNPTISIIIVNYNTSSLLKQCLSSIYHHTVNIPFEIIVVDNGSTDGSPQMINRDFPEVILIKNEENPGFGKANNQAARLARGKYLWMLNSDTILLNNAAEYYIQFYKSENIQQIGVLGSMLLSQNLQYTHTYDRFPAKRIALKKVLNQYFRIEDLDYIKESRFNSKFYFEVDYITGANIFMSYYIFDYYKGFDESYFLYFEETDLQKRISLDGFKQLIIKGPQVIHLGGQSSSSGAFSMQKELIIMTSMFHYFRKFSSYFSFKLFRIAYFFLFIPKLIWRTKIPISQRIECLKLLCTKK